MVPIIKRNKKKALESLLTDDQLLSIQSALDISCTGQFCISREVLYEQLKGPLALDIELYQFEKIMTYAIKSGKIKGFETRTGQNGGICRAGVFAEHDKKRRKTKEDICTISIDDKVYRIKNNAAQVSALMLSVFRAEPTNNNPSLYINSVGYKLPKDIKPTEILEDYILNVLGASKVIEAESEAV